MLLLLIIVEMKVMRGAHSENGNSSAKCVCFVKCTQLCRVLSYIPIIPNSKEMLLKLQVSEMNQMFTQNLLPDGDFENAVAVFAY